jgi:hypothetical protein
MKQSGCSLGGMTAIKEWFVQSRSTILAPAVLAGKSGRNGVRIAVAVNFVWYACCPASGV